jgi:hypothetical protein
MTVRAITTVNANTVVWMAVMGVMDVMDVMA